MNIRPIETEIFPQYFPPHFSMDMPEGNGETILLVDDEELVRRSVARTLERHHYKVHTAHNGITAVDVFRQHQSAIALVITDIVMPDMNGAALLHVLRILAPDLAAIAVSGYAPTSPEIDLLQEDQKHFLAKPFTTDELLRMVRNTLDAASERFDLAESAGARGRWRRHHARHA